MSLAHKMQRRVRRRPRETHTSSPGLLTCRVVLSDAATVGKKQLVKNTDRAFAEGAFGLPWMTCVNSKGETEGFWGVDHLGQVAQFLGLDKPKQGGWKSVL